MRSASDHIWAALQQGGIGAAVRAARAHMPPEEIDEIPVEDHPIWACVLAATPYEGRGNTPLWEMKNILPRSEGNPTPALTTIKRLANAIADGDDSMAVRAVGKIRHYVPGLARWHLAPVLRDLIDCNKIAPGSERAVRLFQSLEHLI